MASEKRFRRTFSHGFAVVLVVIILAFANLATIHTIANLIAPADPTRDSPHGNSLSGPMSSSWSGVPVEQVGNELVFKGTNFVKDSRQLFLQYMTEFLQVYNNRPDKVNLCGIRINHAYALYLTVKVLQPTAVIESGVNAGQSTYFIRMASNTTRIFPIDPLEKPICGQEKRWIDTVNSEYYTGSSFKDMGEIDWATKIASGEITPHSTLVFLDDHLNVFDRLPLLMRYGFRHILVEDNYKKGKGASREDKAGWTPKQVLARDDSDSQFFFHQLISYAEFPPLFPPIMSKEFNGEMKKAGGFLHRDDASPKDIVEPMFRPDLGGEEDKRYYDMIASSIGVDPSLQDFDSYMQFMNYNHFTYMELRPMAQRLVPKFKII